MNKLSQFFSVFVNSFAWQTLILALLNVFLGSGFVFNAYSVIQCFIVALVISVLMFVTDMILSNGFKLKLSLLTVSIIDILEVFAVVMVVGGAIFGWFDFVMSDLLIAAGVIIAVFLIVFTIHMLRMKADSNTINKILKNRMYTGDMIQNVQTKLNYKSQKRICLSSEYWIIVENTHEPLVDRVIFNQIQVSANRTRTVKLNRPQRLLEGLLYCKECGNKLTVSYREKRNYWSINCNKYSRSPRQRLCEPHFSEYNSFEKVILNQIKKTCKKYIEKVDIDSLVSNIKSEKDNKEDLIIEKQKLENNIKELQLKIDALYEDKYNGIISVDTYTRLSSNTENLIRTYNSRIKELENSINEVPKKYNDEETKQKIKELISMKKPTRELLFILVDKIIVDKDKNVKIIYKFSV